MKLGEDRLHGLPVLRIETVHCTAALSLHGGQLLSFVPAGQDHDLLWLTSTPRPAPQPIRGGVPVCWPWFARQGAAADAPQHGTVRTRPWTLLEARADGDAALLELAAPDDAHPCLRLRQTLRLGAALEQALETHNAGSAPVALSQALHSYFHVGDAHAATLAGVAGLDYQDKYDGARHHQYGDWSLRDARDPGRSDRIYAAAGGRYRLHDPVFGRDIEIATGGSASVVVWNPGAGGIAALGDVPPAEGPRFVCVEAANAGADARVLAPGQRHVLVQRVRATTGREPGPP
ncbi:MAG: D-hexose-6-phosphate mutarotase [Pseudoxanthomonas sp.]